MGALETLVASAREREAAEKVREAREAAELEAVRRQRDVEKVREVAVRTFTPELLNHLNPTYEPAKRNLRPTMIFNVKGLRFCLHWREFLWAEPGRQDYLEGHNADGTAVQFSPDFSDNDEKLALLIEGFSPRRSWLRILLRGS